MAPRLGKSAFARVDGDVFWDLAISDGADAYFYRGPDFILTQVLHIEDFAFAGPVAVPGADMIAVSHDNPAAILAYPNVADLSASSVDSEPPTARPMLRAIPSVASSSATLTWADAAHSRPPNRIVIR